MNEIIDAIIIGITTGISTVEASNDFSNLKKLVKTEKVENFKIFLSKIITGSKNSLELVKNRNFRSFNSFRLALVFTEVYRILEKENIDSLEKIAEKILIPSLELISEDENIENDENLKKRWAYLLSHEAKGNKISKRFIEILDRMEQNESIILDYLYGKQFHTSSVGIVRSELGIKPNLADEAINILVGDNLCRVNNSGESNTKGSREVSEAHEIFAIFKNITLTPLGEKFMFIVAPEKSYEFKISQDTPESSS